MNERCPNCDHALPAPTPKFCPDCGQETRVRAPTLGEFLQQFGGAYFSTEGALWRTLKLLLLKPGELTVQYLRGRRKHYVLPLRLYLTVSVLVLLALRLVASQALHSGDGVVIEQTPASAKANLYLGFGVGGLGFRHGEYFCENLPQWVCERARQRLDVDRQALHRIVVEMGERVVDKTGVAMFLLLPAFAAALLVVYWNRRLRYTEHLVFALHVHAFWFLMLALSLPDWGWLTFAAMLAVPAYTMRAMRTVYGGRFAWRLLRAAVLVAVYLSVMMAVLFALSLWAFLA